MVPSTENVFPHAIYTADMPLGRHLWKFGQWLCRWARLQTLTLLRQKTVISLPYFMRQKTISDDLSSPFLFFILNWVIKGTKKTNEKGNKTHWLDFLKVCWYRTCKTAHRQSLPRVQGLSSTKITCSRHFELFNLFKNQGTQNLTLVFVTKPN